jgi:hypothetical protein
MKFWPHRHRKIAVLGTAAVVVAIATPGTYLVASSNDPAQTQAQIRTPETTAAGPGGAVQFIARAKASGAPSASPSSTAKSKAKTKASQTATPGGQSSSAAAGGEGESSSGATSRSPYSWPFSWDSIWNIPIAATASYAAANITTAGVFEDVDAVDYDSINPSYPVVSLQDAELANGSTGSVSVYGDPSMSAGGTWNGCSAFLGTDGSTVYQGQTLDVSAGGNPSFGGDTDEPSAPVNLEGEGITGCHGGSGLSGLGGTLTLADLTQSGPIAHALKIELNGALNYSSANGGFRWPAVNADAGDTDAASVNYYGGSNANVVEGSLLALPTSISPSSFSNPTVAKLARALQDYGAYIVDTTASGTNNFSTIITNYNASSTLVSDACSSSCSSPFDNKDVFTSQLDTLLNDLDVITNNTSSTPGGGAIGASRCAAYAPAFTNGSDAPPAVPVVSC